MSKPDGAMAIGRHLYLFTAKVPTDECLISAHGGGLSGNVMFSVPSGVSVHFYVPHGFTLQDPGIALAAARRQPTETVVGPGQCHDYELSKFQGRHGNNAETYESISTRVERESADLLKYRRRVADASSDVMRQGAQVQLDSVHPFHAVTIRSIDAGWETPGPGAAWIHLDADLVAGETTSQLCRFVTVADMANGVASTLPYGDFQWINPDLTVALHRVPDGPWIGLEGHSLVGSDGIGVAHATAFDAHGAFGHVLQTQLVRASIRYGHARWVPLGDGSPTAWGMGPARRQPSGRGLVSGRAPPGAISLRVHTFAPPRRAQTRRTPQASGSCLLGGWERLADGGDDPIALVVGEGRATRKA